MKNYEWVFKRKKLDDRIKSLGDVEILPGDFIVFSDEGPLITREVRLVNSSGVEYAPLMWGETVLGKGGLVKLKDVLEVFRKRTGPRESLTEVLRKMKTETPTVEEVPKPLPVIEPEVAPEPAPVKPSVPVQPESPKPFAVRTFGMAKRPGT